MKIRTDFVTNSSSSSFVACGVLSAELADFIRELLGGAERGLSKERVGALHIDGDIVSVTTNLQFWDAVEIPMDDDDDLRTEEEKEEDNESVADPWSIEPILADFLPELTEEQDRQFRELLKEASDNRRILGKTYVDSTDSFEFVDYQRRDFLLRNYKMDRDGKVTAYREGPGQEDPLQLLPHLTIGGGAFRDCRRTERIITGFPGMLEPEAFAGCTCLKELTISMGMRSVPEGLCRGCTALRKVELPEHVYIIREGAFAGCSDLEEINLPETLMFVYQNAFSGCDKLPAAIREKLSSLPDEREHQRQVREVTAYIRTHGDAHFKAEDDYPGNLRYWKTVYERWHGWFDPWFDYPQTLPRGNVRYMGYGELTEDLTAYGWQPQKNMGKRVDVLVVDTDNIPQIMHYSGKLKALDDGDPEKAERYGRTILEKAVELKKSGQNIRIISRAHLRECMAAGAFAAEPFVPQTPEEPAGAEKPAKVPKPSKKAEELEQVSAALREHCARAGKKFDSLSAVNGFILEMGFKPDLFRPLISKTYDMTLADYFAHIGVLSTGKQPQAPREEPPAKAAPVSQPRDRAGIPADILKKMDKLFVRLDDVYPDKVISGLNRDHKKWGETVTALYRALDYESPKAFLEAYGYTYAAESRGGRPKTNHAELIEELRRRHPNGCASLGDLKEADPDLSAGIKSLENQSRELFGMTFGKYLRSIGLIR